MRTRTWCPECGPNVDIDTDGCCAACGATATGRGVEEVAGEITRLRHYAEFMCRAVVDAVLAGWDPDSCERVRLAALAYRDACQDPTRRLQAHAEALTVPCDIHHAGECADCRHSKAVANYRRDYPERAT